MPSATAERRPRPGAAPKVSSSTDIDHDHRTAGEELRDEGTADAVAPAWALWREAAEAHLEVLASSGVEFTADVLVDEVGMPPVSGSPNAIGGLFIAAARAGLIRRVGFTTSRRRSRHAGIQRIWMGAAS